MGFPDSRIARQFSHDAIIRVTDTGQGILPEHMTHIFEPFARCGDRDQSGTSR